MKKKLLSLLVATTIMATFVGCGNDTSASTSSDSTASEETTEIEDTETAASASDVWEVDGKTYKIPYFWNQIEVSDGYVDSALAETLKATDEEYSDSSQKCENALFDDILGEDADELSQFEKSQAILENLGDPVYKIIDAFYITPSEMDDDYKDEYFCYVTAFYYRLDDETYAIVTMQDLYSNLTEEDAYPYAEANSIYLCTKDQEIFGLSSSYKDSSIKNYVFLEEDGTL